MATKQAAKQLSRKSAKVKTQENSASETVNSLELKNRANFISLISNIKTTQLLYTLLLVASFLLGYLVARVQFLEKGGTITSGSAPTQVAAGTVTKDSVKAWAKEARLNSSKFNSCVDSQKYKANVDKDLSDGKQVLVNGTPTFFINGHSVVGAQPYTIFQKVIDFELKSGDWNNPDSSVAELVDGNPNNGEIGKEKQNVGFGNLPPLGNKNVKVAIVEFSDFECPFCRRFFSDTFSSVKKDYIDNGKVVYYFRHFPLDFHPLAIPFAVASECANEQGKFWKYHDIIFQKQSTTT